jgi:hypothetical protein
VSLECVKMWGWSSGAWSKTTGRATTGLDQDRTRLLCRSRHCQHPSSPGRLLWQFAINSAVGNKAGSSAHESEGTSRTIPIAALITSVALHSGLAASPRFTPLYIKKRAQIQAPRVRTPLDRTSRYFGSAITVIHRTKWSKRYSGALDEIQGTIRGSGST